MHLQLILSHYSLKNENPIELKALLRNYFFRKVCQNTITQEKMCQDHQIKFYALTSTCHIDKAFMNNLFIRRFFIRITKRNF